MPQCHKKPTQDLLEVLTDDCDTHASKTITLILCNQKAAHRDAQVTAAQTFLCSTFSSYAHKLKALQELHATVRCLVSVMSIGHCDAHHQWAGLCFEVCCLGEMKSCFNDQMVTLWFL